MHMKLYTVLTKTQCFKTFWVCLLVLGNFRNRYATPIFTERGCGQVHGKSRKQQLE